MPDHSCFQNNNFGQQEPGYHIDINVEIEDPTTAPLYNDARLRWMDVIIGDLPSRQRSNDPTTPRDPPFGPCANALPPVIDDMYICSRDAFIGRPGGVNVLARAGPLWVRAPLPNAPATAITGEAVFDTEDIATLKDQSNGGQNRLT